MKFWLAFWESHYKTKTSFENRFFSKKQVTLEYDFFCTKEIQISSIRKIQSTTGTISCFNCFD